MWTQRVEETVAARSARLRTELRAAVAVPPRDVTEVFDTVFAEITPSLAAQRQTTAHRLAEGNAMTQIIERPPASGDDAPDPSSQGPRCGPSFRS